MSNDKKAISVRNIPADLLAKAKRLAEKQDRPLSLVIRDLLRAYVAEQEHKQATK